MWLIIAVIEGGGGAGRKRIRRRKEERITTPMFRQRIQICARRRRINQTRVCITYTTQEEKERRVDDGENMSKQQLCPHIKNTLPRDGFVECTNSWHNRFREAVHKI